MHVNLDKQADGDIRGKCLDLAGDDAELMFLDGFDGAIVGIGEVCGNPPVVIYDRALILDKLVEDNGGDFHAAQEYYDHNIAGAFMGSGMPVLLTRL